MTLGKNALLSIKRAYKKYLLRYPPYTTWEPLAMVSEVSTGPYNEREIASQFNNDTDDEMVPEILN